MRGVAGCFHLAAIASVERSNLEWLTTHRTNLTGSIAVFDQARRQSSKVPVVYASSAAVYGSNQDIPLSEDAAKRPLSAYGADKLGTEQHACVASLVHGVPTCGLRFFNVFGPRQDPRSPYSGVISIFCDRLSSGRDITIFGDGRQVRDFVYVGDVVRALVTAMGHASTQANVFNVCTGRRTTILEVAQTIGDLLGIEPDVALTAARTGEVRLSAGDPTRARAAMNFEAVVDLRTGLNKLLEYNRERLC
jgi:UDP-glucose 4-epimerase